MPVDVSFLSSSFPPNFYHLITFFKPIFFAGLVTRFGIVFGEDSGGGLMYVMYENAIPGPIELRSRVNALDDSKPKLLTSETPLRSPMAHVPTLS